MKRPMGHIVKLIAALSGAFLAVSQAQAAEMGAPSPAPQENHDLVYLGDVPPEGGAPRRSDFLDVHAMTRTGAFATSSSRRLRTSLRRSAGSASGTPIATIW